MSIPRAVWTCPTCGFETDFPKAPHPCLLKDCPHQGRTIKFKDIPTTHSSDPALWDDDENKHWLMVKGPRTANEIVSDFWKPMTDRPLPVTRASVVELFEVELKRALEFGEAIGRNSLGTTVV